MTMSGGMTSAAPQMPPKMQMSPAMTTPPPAGPTPRQAQRQVRQMGFTLTLREVEMAVRVCKGTLIPTDSEEFSIRLHEILMRQGTAGGPGGMEHVLPGPTTNTEPIRTYTRVRLARVCSQGMPRVVGADGDRKDWTASMFDKALEYLPEIENEVSRIIIESKLTQ